MNKEFESVKYYSASKILDRLDQESPASNLEACGVSLPQVISNTSTSVAVAVRSPEIRGSVIQSSGRLSPRDTAIRKIEEVREITLSSSNFSLNMNSTTEGGYGEHFDEIERLIEEDLKSVMDGILYFSSGEIHLTIDNSSLTDACQRLIRDYKCLFQDETEFRSLWSRFINIPEFNEYLREFIPAPISTDNPSGIRYPEFDLESMAYHSYRHANEMYQDTYQRLKCLEFVESTCQVAAMTAFFHDLIQRVDDSFPIPLLGKNERVNVKILNFMIGGLRLEDEIEKALTHFINSSLVGGTFLVKVLTAQREMRNVSLAEHSDSMINCCSELREALHIIKTVRRVLAENDVSRTLNKESFSIHPSVEGNKIIAQLIASLRASISPQELTDFTRKKGTEESFGAHLISRLFQSIRFLAEINQFSVKEVRDPKVSKGAALEKIPYSFLEKLKLSKTWTEGRFSELDFAMQSNHTEYANFLRDFSVLITAGTNADVKELIYLALTVGQEGNYIIVLP